MSYVISDSFKQVLRDMSSPIVVLAEFYQGLHLYSVSHYSLYPFELDYFLTNFKKPSINRPSVAFYGLIPPKSGNEFSKHHIVTL